MCPETLRKRGPCAPTASPVPGLKAATASSDSPLVCRESAMSAVHSGPAPVPARPPIETWKKSPTPIGLCEESIGVGDEGEGVKKTRLLFMLFMLLPQKKKFFAFIGSSCIGREVPQRARGRQPNQA